MNLRFADAPIIRFFRHILLKECDVPELPLLNPNSEILNKEMLTMLYLSNKEINHANRPLCMVYSSSKHGKKMDLLTDCLKYYDGELIWIFKHVSSYEDKKRGLPKIAIFGAYTGIVPQQNGHDTSDKECYLFS